MRSVVPWMLLVACGDGITTSGDDGPAPARVAVTVRVADDADTGIPGARAYAQTLADLVDGSAITGSDGAVTLEVEDGGTVSVVDDVRVTTFMGVKAGDVLMVPHARPLPEATVPLAGPFPSLVDAVWTTCGTQTGPLVGSLVFPRCNDAVDVMFEEVGAAKGSVQTLVDVATATVDVSLPLETERAETVTVHGDVTTLQWLVTRRGHLKYAYPPFGLPFQFPALPDSTIKTIAISSLTGTFVVDSGPLTDSYELDVRDDVPAVAKGYRQTSAGLHWTDLSDARADVAVVTADSWTLVAPITYANGEGSVRLPDVATFASTPAVSFVRTYRFGDGYDAHRGQAARDDEAFSAELAPVQFGQVVSTARATPSQRFVVQLIPSCLVTNCP